jgi:hypothetical protein
VYGLLGGPTDRILRGGGSVQLTATGGCVLAPTAGQVVEIRQGTSAQVLRLYNTYTDGSNYERAAFSWSGNVFTFGPEAAGTGTTRALIIQGSTISIAGTATTYKDTNAGGNNTPPVVIGATATSYYVVDGSSISVNMGFVVRNASSNFIRVAVVEGHCSSTVAGSETGYVSIWTKGAATTIVERWRFTDTAHLISVTDGAGDIGQSGATRPRNIYLTGSIAVKTKAGAPVDGDYTNPVDGMVAVDTTNNKWYVRIGGTWKGVTVA